MKCFHHTDNDGICCKYIVLKEFPDITCIPVSYSNPFPYERINDNEHIIIVDLSFKSDDELQPILNRTKNIIWIDHHISSHAITHKITGLRSKKDPSGSFLTWVYFFPKTPMPRMVELVNDYDLWQFKYKETKLFNLGLSCYYDKPEIWAQLLNSEPGVVEQIIENGKIIQIYIDKYQQDFAQYAIYETTFKGHSAIVCNVFRMNSEVFNQKKHNCDLMITWYFNGHRYNFTLYSNKVDCEKIAKEMGGGGHASAAGFKTHEFLLPVLP